ncbi:DUF4043 family protein [Comamonas sp. 26]|uniref:phage capsid family protein n=1 Tax=Comamonas sp. 26 TaxID=2035201 RepID=UPI000C601846|nr:uncharacterized protein DUF4043 [Comamonas sp. 26]
MSKTSVGAGSANAQFVQAAGLFAQSMQRNSKLNQMVGTMPKGEGSAAATLRKQTATDMPIVRTVDLSRGKGDEVEFHFVQPVGAYPIMGARMTTPTLTRLPSIPCWPPPRTAITWQTVMASRALPPMPVKWTLLPPTCWA